MKKRIILVLSWFIVQQSLYANSTEKAGDIIQVLIPSIAYGTTFYLDDEEGRNQFYKSFGTNLAVTYGLKYAVNRERPNGGDHSFPSGHTSAAFQGAAFIHKRYGINYAIPAYLGAAFVGYSRVDADKHYTSDVIAGAVIGTLSSFYFTTEYQGYTVKPTVNNNGTYGVNVSKKF